MLKEIPISRISDFDLGFPVFNDTRSPELFALKIKASSAETIYFSRDGSSRVVDYVSAVNQHRFLSLEVRSGASWLPLLEVIEFRDESNNFGYLMYLGITNTEDDFVRLKQIKPNGILSDIGMTVFTDEKVEPGSKANFFDESEIPTRIDFHETLSAFFVQLSRGECTKPYIY